MSTPTLAVYLFGYNVNKILYPWKASITSACALADAVYFCECYSEDDTWNSVNELAQNPAIGSKLRLVRHPWGTHHTIQAKIGNYLLDTIGQHYDFALKLDADEVLCEWSFARFAEDMAFMRNTGMVLGRPHYTHFCPDDKHEFDFIYRSKAVLMDTRAKFRFSLEKGGDACALGGAKEYQTHLEIFHYGKMGMGREEEALNKEYTFQQLYTELGFPDPLVIKQKLDLGYIEYEEIFHVAKEKGQFRKYDGQHPHFVRGYLEEQRIRESVFRNSLRKRVTG